MTIRLRTFLGVFLIILVAILMALFASNYFLLTYFTDLETKNAQRNISVIWNNLEREFSYLNRTLEDWSNWDDTYRFIQDGNEAYKIANLYGTTWESLAVDGVLIWNNDGNLSYRFGEVEKLFSDFANRQLDDRGYSGFIYTNRLMMVCARPIYDTQEQLPPRGWFLMSRDFGPEEIQTIVDAFPVPFSISVFDREFKDEYHIKEEDFTEQTFVRLSSHTTLDGFYLFKGLYDQERFCIHIRTDRDIYVKGRQVINLLIFYSSIIATIAFFVQIYFLNKRYLSKLLMMSRVVNRIISSKDIGLRLPVQGEDEMAGLGKDINLMLQTLEEDQKTLKEREHRLKEGERIGHYGYWEWDVDHDIESWTDGLYRVYGLDPDSDENPKDIFFRYFSEEEKSLLAEAEKRIRECKPYRYIHRITMPDGTMKYLKEEAEGVFNGSELIKVVGTTQDVTEAVLAQKELESSKAQLKNANYDLEELNRDLEDAYARIDHLARTLENMLHLTAQISDTVQGNVMDFLNQIITLSLFLVQSIQYAGAFLREGAFFQLKISRRPGLRRNLDYRFPAAGFDKAKNQRLHLEWGKIAKGSTFDIIQNSLGDYLKEVKESLLIPLILHGEVYGYLSLEVDQNHFDTITEEDIRISEALGNIGSSFLMLQTKLDSQDNLQKGLVLSMIQILEYYDEFTKGHSENVAKYAAAMAEKLGMSKSDIKKLYWTGLVHDIGKLMLPKEILNKPDKLTAEEFQAVRQHSEWGAKVLCISDETKDIAKIVLYHHERFDGKGYPENLSGESIPIESRIIAVADSFDAMTNARSYKHPISVDNALTELKKNRGTQFDPYIVDVFIEGKLYLL
jgi:putative nucleotidyltransferase with HDIG domain